MASSLRSLSTQFQNNVSSGWQDIPAAYKSGIYALVGLAVLVLVSKLAEKDLTVPEVVVIAKGLVQLATGLQAASSTSTGSSGAFLALPALDSW